MKELSSLLSSLFLHTGFALGALYFTTPLLKPNPEKPLYTVNLVEPKQGPAAPIVPHKIIEPEPKLVLATKKRVIAKKKFLQKKSPVKILTPQPGSSRNNPMDARLLVQRPGNKPPLYSRVDRLRKRTGQVIILGYVNEMGLVDKAEVIENSGSRTMAENSLEAFRQYQFEKNQPGWVKMPYQFVLEGPEQILSTRHRLNKSR